MRVAAVAGGWALAEIMLGLAIGEFAARARAEPVAFLMVRPPLLAILAWVIAPAAWRERLAIYVLALLLALAGETLTIMLLGGPLQVAATARTVGVAVLLLAVSDGVMRAARRFGGRVATIVAALILLLAASLPVVREGGAAMAMSGRLPAADDSIAALQGDRLAILTALPIVWGEGDIADMLAGRTEPAVVHRLLQRHYAVTPIDRADGAALAGQKLLLIAQPRLLDPQELLAIDQWVRTGGRVLILADPALVWPSRWPPGDPRRAPPMTLLDPLLTHWRLTLSAPADPAARTVRMLGGSRLETQGVGRFAARGRQCRLMAEGLIADCRIGRGRALLVADADLLDGRQWIGPGPRGTSREQRRADNAELVLGWLTTLVGRGERTSRGAVAWIAPDASLAAPVTIGLLPVFLTFGAALWLAKSRVDPFGSGRRADVQPEATDTNIERTNQVLIENNSEIGPRNTT